MKILSTLVFCGAVLSPAAFAAETGTPLSSGKPAGVKKAQVESSTVPWLWIGLGAAAIAIVAASSGSDGKSTPATTSTSP